MTRKLSVLHIGYVIVSNSNEVLVNAQQNKNQPHMLWCSNGAPKNTQHKLMVLKRRWSYSYTQSYSYTAQHSLRIGLAPNSGVHRLQYMVRNNLVSLGLHYSLCCTVGSLLFVKDLHMVRIGHFWSSRIR